MKMHKILAGKSERRDLVGDLGVVDSTILKLILQLLLYKVDMTYLAQNQWRAQVNRVMNLWVP
jgi:hypothetical protein